MGKIAGGEFASESDYLCHLIAQDQARKTNPDAALQSVFDRAGVKNRAEFMKLVGDQAAALRNHPGEIEDQEFLESIQDFGE